MGFWVYMSNIALLSRAGNPGVRPDTPCYSLYPRPKVKSSQVYRAPMIPLFRHAPGESDPTFFLNTDMWDLP